MCACIEHDKYEFRVMLFPNEQPVRLDVTFPLATAVAMKHMWKIGFWKFPLGG